MVKELVYKCWFRFGNKFRLFKNHNQICNTALSNARRALEEAMTPQLQSLIEDGYMCKECGNYRGKDNE